MKIQPIDKTQKNPNFTAIKADSETIKTIQKTLEPLHNLKEHFNTKFSSIPKQKLDKIADDIWVSDSELIGMYKLEPGAISKSPEQIFAGAKELAKNAKKITLQEFQRLEPTIIKAKQEYKKTMDGLKNQLGLS